MLLLNMAKHLKIIGVCPFCQRDVGNDMRPINNLDAENMQRLLGDMDMVDCEASTSGLQLSDNSEMTNMNENVNSSLTVTLDDKQISLKSAVPFTDTILNIVKTEFERPKTTESSLTEEQAELIVTILTEEQHTYGSFLDSLLKKKRKP